MYDILQKLMELPFQLPRYYFRTRHCIGAELFIFGADSGNKDKIITPPGFQLSLNLCIQLKNMLARTSAQLAKLYCILAARYLKEDAGKANEINIVNGDEDLVTACSYQINWHSCCIDTNGSHWSLLPLNAGVSFSVKRL
ncbi:hypothetical protein ACMD2_20992 [Ananas comosus]|uniref:Integrator complex subunit 7-like C-terminal domain-containing protein n=1 Tax=Ananas comosus TaxID=4615 RepID=A0A199VMS3_ANACO|nr:hypothetical protein ACMD2_20992 [Ananas comosus]